MRALYLPPITAAAAFHLFDELFNLAGAIAQKSSSARTATETDYWESWFLTGGVIAYPIRRYVQPLRSLLRCPKGIVARPNGGPGQRIDGYTTVLYVTAFLIIVAGVTFPTPFAISHMSSSICQVPSSYFLAFLALYDPVLNDCDPSHLIVDPGSNPAHTSVRSDQRMKCFLADRPPLCLPIAGRL